MRRVILLTVGVCVIAVLMLGQSAVRVSPPVSPPTPNAVEDDIAVYFSPNGGAADAVTFLINSAKRSIYMQAFMLSSSKLANALIAAHRRGVDVQVIMDDQNHKLDFVKFDVLRKAGITVWVLKIKGMKMHNKVVLIDERYIVTGSFNFTVSADEKNIENLLVIRNKPRLYRAYANMHKKLKSICKKYAGK